MKVYKNDIYYFLNKVEEKAIKHVQDEFLERVKTLKEDTRFQGIIDDFNSFKSAAQIIEDVAIKYTTFPNNDVNKFYLRDIERPELFIYKRFWKDVEIRGLDALLVSYISSYVSEYPEYSWVTTHREKVEGIIREYTKLRRLIESTKSNNKCINLLKDLGYDVSSLGAPDKDDKLVGLDTSKLLVCKEGDTN